MKKINKKILLLTIFTIFFTFFGIDKAISDFKEFEKEKVVIEKGGKSVKIYKENNLNGFSDDVLFMNGKRRCVRNGGTFYEYPDGSYFCKMSTTSTSKLSNVQVNESAERSKKKDCFEKGGTWVTNSTGSFCYRHLTLNTKSAGNFIKCDNGMTVPVSLGCDGFIVLDQKKVSYGEIEWFVAPIFSERKEKSSGMKRPGRTKYSDIVLKSSKSNLNSEGKEALKTRIKFQIELIEKKIKEIIEHRSNEIYQKDIFGNSTRSNKTSKTS